MDEKAGALKYEMASSRPHAISRVDRMNAQITCSHTISAVHASDNHNIPLTKCARICREVSSTQYERLPARALVSGLRRSLIGEVLGRC